MSFAASRGLRSLVRNDGEAASLHRAASAAKMIIASVFSFSLLVFLTVIACQQTIVSAFDSITRLGSDSDVLPQPNRSTIVNQVLFQGFGHIVTKDEDDGSDSDGGDDADSSVDANELDSNFTSFIHGNQQPTDFNQESDGPGGCTCSPDSFSCECFGDMVHEVPKNLSKNVKRM